MQQGFDRFRHRRWSLCVLDQASPEQRHRFVQTHVHTSGDRLLQMVLLVGSQFERAGEDELAPSGWVGLGEGIAPVLDARPQPIAPLEDRRTLTCLEHRGPGRRGVLRLAIETRKEGGGGRADLGKDLGVPVGEVGRAGSESLSEDVDQMFGPNAVEATIEARVRRAAFAFWATPIMPSESTTRWCSQSGSASPRRLRPTVHEAQVPKVHQLAVPGWSSDVSPAARSE